ncbi:MAG: DNA repair protein [Rhodobacter sp.]|nr:DNA repair protein [Rhodobacter sp.]
MKSGEADASAKSRRDLGELVEHGQRAAILVLGALAVASFALTLLAMLGIIPWLEIEARFGPLALPAAGPIVQVLFTLFCACLLVFMPANLRILRLENSHRNFALDMQDIVRAYSAAHATDRSGAFTLSDEFAAVRERLQHLRAHPDLGHLEPEILEISAQMSYIARDLAQVYSDDSVVRARAFLTQRQEEAARYADLLGAARRTCDELKRWLEDVESEERQNHAQLRRLDADLQEILPRIGYALEFPESTVVPMQKKQGTPPPRVTGH